MRTSQAATARRLKHHAASPETMTRNVTSLSLADRKRTDP